MRVSRREQHKARGYSQATEGTQAYAGIPSLMTKPIASTRLERSQGCRERSPDASLIGITVRRDLGS
jgi:hypothetical protein